MLPGGSPEIRLRSFAGRRPAVGGHTDERIGPSLEQSSNVTANSTQATSLGQAPML